MKLAQGCADIFDDTNHEALLYYACPVTYVLIFKLFADGFWGDTTVISAELYFHKLFM